MSRILNGKKTIVCIVITLLIVFFTILKYFIFAGFLALVLVLFLYNCYVNYIIYDPLKKLWASRPVNQIEAVVIGNICSKKTISKFCNLNHTLFFTAPNRSMLGSRVILYHVESVIKKNGTVIISLPQKDSGMISWFDFPYLNKISLYEYGIANQESYKSNFPIIFHLRDCLRFLFGYKSSNISSNTLSDEKIVSLCERKGFNHIIIS